MENDETIKITQCGVVEKGLAGASFCFSRIKKVFHHTIVGTQKERSWSKLLLLSNKESLPSYNC